MNRPPGAEHVDRPLRTLLVDNYDSFTYNVHQYLGEVNGVAPTVLRNDADLAGVDLAGFDNVVLSPGPGHPAHPGDLGIGADLLRTLPLPVLGVCLGHQAICQLAGAVVEHAPRPVHGLVSRITHTGTELFAGIPSPFDAVRYHSLIARDLPAHLEATAWTDDGLLMAVRHRHAPVWGVQFHPESICSQHGRALFANFRDLTRRQTRSRPRVEVSAAPRAVPDTGRYRLHVRTVPRPPSAEAAYTTLFRRGGRGFWLDSGDSGRFSFLGDDTGPLAEFVSYRVADRTVRTTRGGRTSTERVTSFFDYLGDALRRRALAAPELPFEFNLGYVGYLGYELKAECGGAARFEARTPDAALLFADRMFVLDNAEQCGYLLCLSDGPTGAEAAQAWLTEAETALADPGTPAAQPVPDATWRLTDPALGGPGQPVLRHDRDAYLSRIAECLTEIRDGESYEVCLTNTATAATPIDPFRAYRTLRRISPAPYGALLEFGELAVLSASPERFLTIGTDGTAEAKPIKGTRPRGADAEADDALRRGLAASEKDRAENLMIVDLLRNDLNRTCEIGSVHVPVLFDVETYAAWHQLVSTVRGTLRPDTDPIEAVRAAFPAGSMTGAPKIRTMGIIDRLEDGPRGVYSGALGWFGLSGALDLSVVIRTVVATADGTAFGVGGAVVALSDPADEFAETLVKSRPMAATISAEAKLHVSSAGSHLSVGNRGQ